jgi:hypothetical protein
MAVMAMAMSGQVEEQQTLAGKKSNNDDSQPSTSGANA